MPISNIHDAKTNLSKLVAAAERGEEVIIARGGKPVVRLVPWATEVEAETPAGKLKRNLGLWKDLGQGPSWEEWKQMDAEIEADFQTAIDKPWP